MPTPTPSTPTSTCVDNPTHTYDIPFNTNNPTQDCAYIGKNDKLCVREAKYCDTTSTDFISNQRKEFCETCSLYDSECGCSDDAGLVKVMK